MKNYKNTQSKKLLNTSTGFSVLLLSLFIMLSIQLKPQVNVQLGAGLGIMSPGADLSGTTLQYYDGSNYGLASGLNFNGKAKLGFAAFNLTGELDITSLSNSGNSEPGQGSIELTQKIVSLKIGPEFRFDIPMAPVLPYLGFNVALNNFSGEATFQGVSKVPSATYSVKSESRFGVGFYGGAEVNIGPFLTLDFNLSYNLMNLSGKSWNDANPGVNQRIDSYLSLNDSGDPLFKSDDDKHFISKDRNINAILFTVTLMFGI